MRKVDTDKLIGMDAPFAVYHHGCPKRILKKRVRDRQSEIQWLVSFRCLGEGPRYMLIKRRK